MLGSTLSAAELSYTLPAKQIRCFASIFVYRFTAELSNERLFLLVMCFGLLLCLFTYRSVTIFVYIPACYSVCLHTSLLLCLFTYRSVTLFVYIPVCYSVCLHTGLLLCLFTYRSVTLFVYIPVCYTVCLHTGLPLCLFTYRSVTLFVYIPVCYCVCLHTGLLLCFFTYRSVSLFVYITVCYSVCLHNGLLLCLFTYRTAVYMDAFSNWPPFPIGQMCAISVELQLRLLARSLKSTELFLHLPNFSISTSQPLTAS